MQCILMHFLFSVLNYFQMDYLGIQMDSGYSSAEALTPDVPATLDWEAVFNALDAFVPGPELNPDQDLAAGAVVHQPLGMQIRGQDISFWIERPSGWSTPFYTSLNFVVTGPSGTGYPGTVTPTSDLNFFRCVFRSFELGLHLGSVFCGTFLLQGSPFNTTLSRDYSTITRPVISLDVEVQSNQPRKPWGITCNTNTEQVRFRLLALPWNWSCVVLASSLQLN